MIKWLLYFGVLVLLIVGGYVYFTATDTIEVQEVSPLQVKDNMDSMTAAEKEQFEQEVAAAQEKAMTMDEEMNTAATLIADGEFKPRAHEVMGKAVLIQDNDKTVLRFEDFETINGPNLHIYLAASLGDEDYLDLGPIKATKGNVNYDVPAGVDTEKYNKVLVWCVPFSVLFSYAELK